LKYKREFKIGLVSFVILIAFIWGVNFIKGHNFFSPNNSYYAVYPSSGGLQTGRVVKINGVTVGLVSDIRFYSPDLDSVVVRFDVDKKYRFTRNSIVEIGSGTSLMSDVEMSIVLVPGGMLAEDGDTLQGVLNGGLMEMIGSTIKPLRTSVVQTLASLDSALKRVNELMDQENQANISSSLASLSVTLENTRKMSADLAAMLDREQGQIPRIADHLASGTGKLDSLLAEVSAEDFASTLADLRSTLANLAEITAKVNSGEGTVGRLLEDGQVYDNLVEATRSLDALLADVKANPRRYVNVSVFGKKEPTETSRVKDSLRAVRLRARAVE